MAGENVVSIVVTAANKTAPAFDAAKASASEVAASMEEYTTAVQRAELAEADLAAAREKLTAVELDGKASEEQLAAAQAAVTDAEDKSAAATVQAVRAQESLQGAQARSAEAAKASADVQAEAGAKARAGSEAAAEGAKLQGDAALGAAKKSDGAAGLMAGAGAKVKMALLGVAVGAGIAVKAASDFQDQTTHLVTDAGELPGKLAMVQQGILQISAATGTSAREITDAMYHVESAGFHGAQGLAVLRVAAQGARVGGAELDTVGKTLTGTMNAYGMSSKDAGVQTKMSVSLMNQLIATVGAGDMRMQDLAASLGNVAPVAATAKISFSEVGGALATMTGQNMSAQQATQDLRHTILSLESPNAVQTKELAKLGLSAREVQDSLGKRGLAATLAMVADAAKKNSGALGQTYTQAMYKAMGGTTGLTVAMMLTGTHMQSFKANADTVAAAARKGGDSVDNWGRIQGTFKFKMDQAKVSIQDTGIALGSALLPAVSAILGPIAHMLSLIAGNKVAAIAFATVVGGVLAGAIGVKAVGALRDMAGGIKAAGDGMSWLVGKIVAMTAAQEGQTVATEAGTVAQEGLDAAEAANPVGLIIIAIIALIAIIVLLATHWKTVWKDVSGVAKATWHFIDDDLIHPLMAGIDAMVRWVESHWKLLATILATVLLGPIGGLVVFVATHWSMIRNETSRLIGDVVHFFESLPGRIMGIMDGLANDLFGAGARVVQFLINGITSQIGQVGHAISNIAGEIRAHLPFSPARKGPLSGAGSPESSGRAISAQLAQGIASGTGAVGSAAKVMAARVALAADALRDHQEHVWHVLHEEHLAHLRDMGLLPGSPALAVASRLAQLPPSYAQGQGGAAGAQPIVIEFHPSGAHGLDSLFWEWLAGGIRVRGGDPRIIQKKVLFA